MTGIIVHRLLRYYNLQDLLEISTCDYLNINGTSHPYCFICWKIHLNTHGHTGKCISRFSGIYAYCRYFIDRKW